METHNTEDSSLTMSLLSKDEDSSIIAEAQVVSSRTGTGSDNTEFASLPVPTQNWETGEKQPPKCRDMPYGIVFLIQFVFTAIYGTTTLVYSLFADEEGGDQQGEESLELNFYDILPGFAAVLTSVIVTFFSFTLLTKYGASFITCSTWTSVVISGVSCILAFLSGAILAGIMCGLGAMFGVCYAIAVRSRIPFAAANMNAGASAVKKNWGVILISFFAAALVLVWVVQWLASLAAISGTETVCPDDGSECYTDMAYPGFVCVWVFNLFWTMQVVRFGMHTIVAGAVSTWFFDPAEAQGCCSKAVRDSTVRSLTTSFGSICFGALLVAIIQFLQWMVRNLRQQRSDNDRNHGGSALLLCCLECILSMMKDIMEYFNKWAFIYVAVYGYPYITAGKKVMNLFQQRGWTVIINDNLVSNTLNILSFAIGLVSAIVCVFFALFVGYDTSYLQPFFWSSFLAALLYAMTVMSIIDSAVNTIIVCFAEAPQEFERNHGVHSREMREGWRKVYPEISC